MARPFRKACVLSLLSEKVAFRRRMHVHHPRRFNDLEKEESDWRTSKMIKTGQCGWQRNDSVAAAIG
jgi:hypothetical protein